ncbi:hypothetical protein E2542_SST27226 [Spatholobus suberectus]|nr:hypothetical protein E2542_SST27226 [Spatholobus suberectus]
MSPSLKSKSKSTAGKDQRKATPATCGTTNHGSGTPASAYNPVSGTFHTLETTLIATSTPSHDNGHFRNIDDTDEHPSSLQGAVSECDSVSNNGSCSGESEDPKEKVGDSSVRQDSVPGSDSERREKIRLKNERKHQRQRERRAQELHDRCCGFLMSRKLESLAQLLVAMGFSSERATLALMLNDGKLEESVTWLFEASETHTKSTTNLEIGGNLKVDVSEELAQISDMEARYNCSKQEVERVVVACEGDLQMAENTLKSQKQESSVIQSKPEESTQINGLMRSQGLPSASVSMQQREIEGDFNYSSVGGSASMFPDPQSMNLRSLHLNHQMPLADKRWVVTRSSPSSMFTMAPSAQVSSPSVKIEVQLNSFGNKGTMFQQAIEREPEVMMQQHPQFTNGNKQDPISSVNALHSGTRSLYANCSPAIENIRSNGKLLQNHNIGSVANGNLEQFYEAHYKEHPRVFGHIDSSSSGVGGFCKPTRASLLPPSIHRGSWSMSAPSPSLTVPPSLGLFSGQSAARTFSSHSHVDWNTGGLMPEFDYTSVDWTLDCASSSSESGELWLGISSLLRNSSGNRMSSSCMGGLQNVGMGRDASSSSGLREWTSPFAGNDIFSLPRQFVTSPPL